ncbi:hypothetical protein Tco_0259593 [Tanacetum coccineum]
MIEGHQVRRIDVDSGSSSEIMYEHCFENFSANARSRLRKCRASLIGFSGETYHPLGMIDLRITMGGGKNKTVLMEFAIVRCHSPYNVLIGRTGMRSLEVVGSAIHSMIKFLTNQGVVTMETSKEALWECKQLDKTLNSWKETQWHQHMEQTSRIREQTILRARNNLGHRPYKEPMLPENERGKGNMVEKVTIYAKQPDQSITIGSTLSPKCKQWLINILLKNVDVLAMAGSGGTAVPQFVMERQLKSYPLAEPVVQRRRPLTPDRRQTLREKVFNWLKEGTIKKIQHPE